MKFPRVALMTLVVSSFASAWYCDERCPDYEKCIQEGRAQGNGRGLEEDMNASASTNTQHVRRDKSRQLGQLDETYFLLKMYHEESTEFCWQSEFEDRRWCMACESCEGCSYATCDEGDALRIQYCNDEKEEQLLVYELYETESGVGRLKPYTAQHLCLEWYGPGSEFMTLQRCQDGNTDQILVGFNMYSPFELHPYGYDPTSTSTPLCLSQGHHPKSEELIRSFDCEDSRDDRTNKWQVYEAVVSGEALELATDGEALGLATAAPSAAPTVDDVYAIMPTASPVGPLTAPPTVSPTAPLTASPTAPPTNIAPLLTDNGDYGLATAAPSAAPTEDDVYAIMPTASPVEPLTASPTVSPIAPPTASPAAPPTSMAPLLTDNGDYGCSPESPCGACVGDCDTDFDCAGDLECFHRAVRFESNLYLRDAVDRFFPSRPLIA